MAITDSDLENLLKTRRSIRVFDGAPVPDTIIRRALDLAFLSPSSSNLQHWQFHRLTGVMPAARRCFLEQVPAMTCSEIIVMVARPDLWKATNDKILHHLHTNKPPRTEYLLKYHGQHIPFLYARGPLGLWGALKSLLVWCRGLVKPVDRHGYFAASLRETAVQSTALAAQTFMMAVTTLGYDTCPMAGFDENRLRRLLKLPHGAVPCFGIAIGKRKANYEPNQLFRFGYAERVIEH